MDSKKRLQKSIFAFILVLGLAVIFVLLILLLQQRGKTSDEPANHTGPHILMLLPVLEEGSESLQQMVDEISDTYDLRVEVMELATTSLQKQMLSFVPETDVDAVLLCSLSNIDEDYCNELTACRQAGIPVVLIGRDFNDHTLRDSFVGSGINSELMVINQMILWTVDDVSSILIGNYSYVGNDESYEFLFFEKGGDSDFNSKEIQSVRLKSFVTTPPDGYVVKEYLQITSAAGGTAVLNQKLLELLRKNQHVGLTFSLNNTLTNALTISVSNGSLNKSKVGCIVGYGDQDELEPYIQSGVIDELIVSDTLYSAYIGVRYLNDILRGFYVPDVLDSGVKLITR